MIYLVLLSFILRACSGAIHTPKAFTLLELSSLNGSDANGGCPSQCIINNNRECDCTGLTEDLSSAPLINGNVPTLDFTMSDTWASQLFTVQTARTSYALGFEFQVGFALREIEIYTFFCPAWNIPRDNSPTMISVHKSLTFPSYTRVSGPPLGNVTLSNEVQNCDSLTKISIPIQTTSATLYFIEFSSVSTIVGGIYIGEVIFSDEILSVSSTSPISTSPTSTETSPFSMTSSPDDTTHPMTMSDNSTSSSTTSTAKDTPINTSPNSNTDITLNTTSGDANSSTSSSNNGATSPTTKEGNVGTEASLSLVIVGALVGVIIVLLLLVLTGGVCVVIYVARKKKSDRIQVQQLQDVVLEGSESATQLKMKSLETETSYNNNYERTVFQGPRIQSPTGTMTTAPNSSMNRSNNSYSTLVQPRAKLATPQISPSGSESKNFVYHDNALNEAQLGTYDTIDTSNKGNNLDTYEKIDQTQRRETPVGTPKLQVPGKPRLYSLINKELPPEVPKKTPELYRALKAESGIEQQEIGDYKPNGYTDMDGTDGESVNPHYASAGTGEPALYSTVDEAKKEETPKGNVFIGEYCEVEGEMSPDEVYSEVTEKQQHPSGKPAMPLSPPKPVTPLSPPCSSAQDTSSLVYTNSDAQEGAAALSEPEVEEIYTDPDKGIYANPDAEDLDNDAGIYDTVTEPIQPSMFVGAEGTKEFKGEDIYAPVYDTSTLTSSGVYEIPMLQPENIKKVKTIGTGYFGKVLLADTVGLSEKDLKLGDSEDKTKSIRVAVKQLKANSSSKAREAFDKELKFMSRLNHENVVRVLGSCKSTTTYIMMEYMEKGDLNQYLVEFENIVVDAKQSASLCIQADTLTSMSAQIANGMRYLSSKNFIHRDLAMRNCLVGGNLQVKIADFGMSRNLYQSHYYVLKGHAILPVRWMAKECFYGKFSTMTDVWAFGVTMWEIFTLAKDIPYEDMEDEELIADATGKERRTLLAKPANCPANVYDIMLTCWEEKPIDRASFDTIHAALLVLIKDTGSN